MIDSVPITKAELSGLLCKRLVYVWLVLGYLDDEDYLAGQLQPGDEIDVANRDYHHLSQSEIGGSIKGDVNKKASPSAGSREVFCLDI